MNVVSIDFDIIMAPSIEFYNHMSGNPELFDNYLTEIFPADLIHYQRLTKWLISQIKNLQENNIIFISSHDSLINYVSVEDTVINIDHHHDLGYPDPTNNAPKIHCGNWAQYLLENNLIKDYIWIKNENSNPIKEFKGNIKEYNFKTYQLNNLYADKIIICLSPEWIPKQYRPLFFSWIDILNEYFNTIYQVVEK